MSPSRKGPFFGVELARPPGLADYRRPISERLQLRKAWEDQNARLHKIAKGKRLPIKDLSTREAAEAMVKLLKPCLPDLEIRAYEYSYLI